MNFRVGLIAALVALVSGGWGQVCASEVDTGIPARAGWFGIFPTVKGFDVNFEYPIIGKTGFRQIAYYLSNTSKVVQFQVRLERFEKGRTVEFVLTNPDLPETWAKQLPLSSESALSVQAYGACPPALWDKIVNAVDLKKAEVALQKPPRTDFRLTKAAFDAIPANASYADVIHWVGEPEKDIGSGIHIMAYPLVDGGRALVGTPDLKTVVYVHFQTKDEVAKWRGP